MRAVVLTGFGEPLLVEERPEPVPRGEELVVRVSGVGVCGSDVHIAAGREKVRLPLVLGHEVAGTCAEMGEVLVYAAWGCGRCRFCSAGDEQLCPQAADAGWERDGGFAEALLVPARRHLFPLERLDPVRAAPLADAGVTPYRAVRRIAPFLGRGAVAVVIGAGGLGQFAIQYLRILTEARVVAVELDDQKRARALELGADEALPPEGLEQRGRVILDFVGSDETLALAAGMVETGGAVVLVGEAGGRLRYDFRALPFEVTLATSVWGARDDLRAVLELARRGELRWDVETLPLVQANEALERVRQGTVTGRLVLVP
jgi:alcohol dehydrogenase, propanol-preferring